jgi:hypothetical protein
MLRWRQQKYGQRPSLASLGAWQATLVFRRWLPLEDWSPDPSARSVSQSFLSKLQRSALSEIQSDFRVGRLSCWLCCLFIQNFRFMWS